MLTVAQQVKILASFFGTRKLTAAFLEASHRNHLLLLKAYVNGIPQHSLRLGPSTALTPSLFATNSHGPCLHDHFTVKKLTFVMLLEIPYYHKIITFKILSSVQSLFCNSPPRFHNVVTVNHANVCIYHVD
jgi:hypothetical protein